MTSIKAGILPVVPDMTVIIIVMIGGDSEISLDVTVMALDDDVRLRKD